eukprot:TRINITY_DN2076_c1_g1_i1.p1 TRINITY_DN2076_c1_g1~~TRINITY_DN2076_c1_g1_i1.p1  ORF type:complete len:1116 (+),score=144.68 TRINITY_DN2076_c1_g1_i1:38-3385(+)
MAGAAFWGALGGAIAFVLILLLLVCRKLGRSAKVNIVDEKPEDNIKLGRLAPPSIVPNGGKHAAGTPVIIIPSERAGVYARIGRPTEVQNEKFTNYDGQTICLGQPNPVTTIRDGDEKLWRVGTFIIQAFSYAPGRQDSEITSTLIEVTPPTGEVFFSHPAGSYDEGFDLTLFHPDTTNILFTYSESGPAGNPWECGIPYTKLIPITTTCEIRAAAQGSRTPAAAKRFVIPELLPPPEIFVASESCAGQSTIVYPGDQITFGSIYGANLLYSMRRCGVNDPQSVSTQPSCTYSSALVATPGTWEIIVLSQKKDWKDSNESFARVLCAPEMPRVDPSTVSGTEPHVVRLLCNGSSDYYPANVIILYHVLVNGESVEGASEPYSNCCELTLPGGIYELSATCYDRDTELRSRELIKTITVHDKIVKKKKLQPCTIHPNGGEHTLGEDPLSIVVNSGDGGGDLSCEVQIRQLDSNNMKTISGQIGEEIPIPFLGRLKVTAVTILPDGTRSAPTFASFNARPPPPKLSPKSGEFTSSSALKVYLYKPAISPLLDISNVNLAYEITKWHGGTSETSTINNNPDATPIPIGATGRYQITATLEVDGVLSPEVSGWYTVHVDPLSAPVPVFKPNRKYHSVGDHISVSLSTVDPLARIFWSTDGEEFNLYKDPIEVTESTTFKAYSTVEGVKNSEIVTQDYEFSAASPGGTRRPLLPPEIYPKKRSLAGRTSAEIILSQPSVSFQEDAIIRYSLAGGPEMVFDPENVIVIKPSDADSEGDIQITAYIEVPGVGLSGSAKKVYSFAHEPAKERYIANEPVKKPVVTVHAHQLLVELRPPEGIKHSEDIQTLYTVDGSFPLTQEGGSTRILQPGKTIEIPRHGCTELRCLCVDKQNRLPPSRVVTKTFSEGIGYLPVAMPDHVNVVVSEDSSELQPPALVAHARVVVLIATCSTADSVIRYSFGGKEVTSDSSIFPSQGLQIVTSDPSTSFVKLAAFKNGIKSEEVHQEFRHVPGTEPERAEKFLDHEKHSPQKSNRQSADITATTTVTATSAQTLPLPAQPSTLDTITGSTLFPPASPLIFTTSAIRPVDTFSRGFADAKARDAKRKTLLASLKKEDEARERHT